MVEQPGLLQVAREKMRARHLAYRTEQAYLQWIRRYLRFHQRHHPRNLGAVGVEQFLTHLAVQRKVSASTQNQALQAFDRTATRVLPVRHRSAPIQPAAGAPPKHGAESPARRIGACRSRE